MTFLSTVQLKVRVTVGSAVHCDVNDRREARSPLLEARGHVPVLRAANGVGPVDQTHQKP